MPQCLHSYFPANLVQSTPRSISKKPCYFFPLEMWHGFTLFGGVKCSGDEQKHGKCFFSIMPAQIHDGLKSHQLFHHLMTDYHYKIITIENGIQQNTTKLLTRFKFT